MWRQVRSSALSLPASLILQSSLCRALQETADCRNPPPQDDLAAAFVMIASVDMRSNAADQCPLFNIYEVRKIPLDSLGALSAFVAGDYTHRIIESYNIRLAPGPICVSCSTR